MTTPANPADLITWLRDQLDDDERMAREAARAVADHTYAPIEVEHRSETTKRWQAVRFLFHKRVTVDDPGWDPKVTESVWTEVAEHIARHDPARVLAEVDAKRRILAFHEGEHDCPEVVTGVYPDDWPTGVSWGNPGERWSHMRVEHFEADEPCPTQRLLALPFADREGFREEWRPA